MSINPNAVFTKRDNWSSFTQQVLAIKAQNGSMTVFADSTARILWLLGNSTTYQYFYYQA